MMTTLILATAFVCNIYALTPAERTRHFEQLGPALRDRRTAVLELDNGYEISFRGDTKTVAMLTEWAEQERRCCPFFDIDLRFEPESGPAHLRLTGPKGTKQFIRIDGSAWVKPVK